MTKQISHRALLKLVGAGFATPLLSYADTFADLDFAEVHDQYCLCRPACLFDPDLIFKCPSLRIKEYFQRGALSNIPANFSLQQSLTAWALCNTAHQITLPWEILEMIAAFLVMFELNRWMPEPVLAHLNYLTF
jgi:hypothetical protein